VLHDEGLAVILLPDSRPVRGAAIDSICVREHLPIPTLTVLALLSSAGDGVGYVARNDARYFVCGKP